MAILSNDVYFSSFLYSIGAYCLDCIIIAFFLCLEREKERKKERKKGWVGLIIPIILTFQICIINMNKRIITNKNAFTELYNPVKKEVYNPVKKEVYYDE